MCRLSAFFGRPICAADLVTRPSRSIITQSFDARERMSGDASTPGYLNGDGFGLGWYSTDPTDVVPCVYKQIRPAWNDPNLGSIAEKVVTPVLFAHVRAASPGMGVSEATCHPFRFGRYLWMHNGGVANFRAVRRRLLPLLSEEAFDFAVTHGSSDTALCFAVFLSGIPDTMAQSSPNEIRRRLEDTIRIVEKALVEAGTDELSLLNFIVSDGDSLIASRYAVHPNKTEVQAASLYFASGNAYTSNEDAPSRFSMVHTSRKPSLAILSSEPLTEERSDWVSVPLNHVILITPAMHITISPVSAADNPAVSRALDNLVDFPNTPRTLPSPSPPPRKSPEMAASGPERFVLSLGKKSVISVAAVNNFLFCGLHDGSIQQYNIDDALLLPPVRTSHGAVMALLGDSRRRLVVSACSASTVCLWRVPPSGHLRLLRVISCDGMGDVLGLCFIGSSLYAGFSDTFARCVVADVDLVPGIDGAPTPAPEQVVLTDGSDPKMPRFPTDSSSVNPHFGFVFAISAWNTGECLVTGCGDGVIRAWDRSSGECRFYREGHAGAVTALAIYEGESGALLFSGSGDQTIKVWDISSGFICKRTLRKHRTDIVFLTISGDRLYSASSDGVVHSWCAESLRHCGQCRDPMISSGAVSSRYGLLFTASEDGMVYARDTRSFPKKPERSRRKAVLRGTTVSGSEPLSLPLSAAHAPVSRGWRVPSASHAVLTKPIRTRTSDNEKASSDTSEDDTTTLVQGISNDLVLAPPIQSNENRPMSRAVRLSKSPFSECSCVGHTGSGRLVSDMSSLSLDVTAARNAENKDSHSQTEEMVYGNSVETSSSDEAGYVEIDKQEIENEIDEGDSNAKLSMKLKEERLLQDVLARFISFATVSGVEEYREDCWQGARYIGSFLEGLGASVKYVATSSPTECKVNGKGNRSAPSPRLLDMRMSKSPVVSANNPIVLARFPAAKENAPTITFYSHYDVMPADSSKWNTDPWKLTALNGRYYGRGTTDNKGPILAMIFAIKSLLEKAKDGLAVNIVLLLEGEGEMSNKGFKECIDKHRQWFGDTSVILTSNSYWLGEERPCINYGMRGVVDLQVTVSGPARNLHSGVDGGGVFEPVNDLLAVTGSLVDSNGTSCVKGFYDDVRSLSEEDKKRLADVEFDLEEYQSRTGVSRFVEQEPSRLLERRWRRPSVSVTSLETSNTTGAHSVLPREATAKLSIRYVPDQSAKKLEKLVREHLEEVLRKRKSPNTLRVVCVNSGDSWITDPSWGHFQIAAKAVRDVWGVEPLYVCEGGTMPIFSFLSKKLDAPIVQVPLGQSSDGAHLPNERIRIMNLHKGKLVLQRMLEELCERVASQAM